MSFLHGFSNIALATFIIKTILSLEKKGLSIFLLMDSWTSDTHSIWKPLKIQQQNKPHLTNVEEKKEFLSTFLDFWLRSLCDKRQSKRRKTDYSMHTSSPRETQENWVNFWNGPSYHLRYNLQWKTKKDVGGLGANYGDFRQSTVKEGFAVVQICKFKLLPFHYLLPWWLRGKESSCQCRRCRFHPWVRKIPWRRKWQPTFQYSFLENPTDRGAW